MNCVYCLGSKELREEQILHRGRHFYLCAPRGQLVEGYLAIAPYRCTGCLAMLPRARFAELESLKDLVGRFYRDVYGVSQSTLYEQGRAGGGASNDELSGFPLHAHLCCLPLAVEIERMLAVRFRERSLAALEDLPAAAGESPYVYVETCRGRFIYLPGSDESRGELERMRLKPEIANLIGMPERGYWRAYPGDGELALLIRRFKAYMKTPAESPARI